MPTGVEVVPPEQVQPDGPPEIRTPLNLDLCVAKLFFAKACAYFIANEHGTLSAVKCTL
jgi:hypothetical protein